MCAEDLQLVLVSVVDPRTVHLHLHFPLEQRELGVMASGAAHTNPVDLHC